MEEKGSIVVAFLVNSFGFGVEKKRGIISMPLFCCK
jgi:hypothetical protein